MKMQEKSRGFYLHSNIVNGVETWIVTSLANQQVLAYGSTPLEAIKEYEKQNSLAAKSN